MVRQTGPDADPATSGNLLEIPDRRPALDYDKTLLHVNVRRGFLFFTALSSVVFLASIAAVALAGSGAMERRVQVRTRVSRPPIRESPQPAAETIANDVYDDLRIMAEVEKQPTPNMMLLRRGFSGSALDAVLVRMQEAGRQGRAFIEVINDLQVEILEIGPTQATVRIQYVDSGYFVNNQTRRQVAPPVSVQRVFRARVVKQGERWKIDTLEPQMSPENR